jgi:hypothetical protein
MKPINKLNFSSTTQVKYNFRVDKTGGEHN